MVFNSCVENGGNFMHYFKADGRPVNGRIEKGLQAAYGNTAEQ
jgi:hypothetical protein